MANWQRGVLKAMGVKNHAVEVIGITDFTPWYRRLRLSAPAFLDQLALHPTIWLRLWAPSLTHDKLVQRGYTIIDPDPATGEFSLDFVLHEPVGPAAHWAKSATVGTRAEVAHTPQRLTIDDGLQTLVLAGDTTALPAINTLLAAAPASANKHVVIQDAHPDHDGLPLAADDRTRVTWTLADTDGNNVVDALAASIVEPLDHDRSYLWCAGERRLVKAVREHARGRLELPRSRQHTQYYWIFGHDAG